MALIQRFDMLSEVGGANKVYHVGITVSDGGSYSVVTAYGARGRVGPGASARLNYTSNIRYLAQAYAQRIVFSKLRKGYVLYPDISGDVFGRVEEEPSRNDLVMRQAAILAQQLDQIREREAAAQVVINSAFRRPLDPFTGTDPPYPQLTQFDNPHRRVARAPIPANGIKDCFGNTMTEDEEDR